MAISHPSTDSFGAWRIAVRPQDFGCLPTAVPFILPARIFFQGYSGWTGMGPPPGPEHRKRLGPRLVVKRPWDIRTVTPPAGRFERAVFEPVHGLRTQWSLAGTRAPHHCMTTNTVPGKWAGRK